MLKQYRAQGVVKVVSGLELSDNFICQNPELHPAS